MLVTRDCVTKKSVRRSCSGQGKPESRCFILCRGAVVGAQVPSGLAAAGLEKTSARIVKERKRAIARKTVRA